MPRVDKIVGPGNIYVATAKRRCSAGRHRHDRRPLGDPGGLRRRTDPDWIAMDLFSQAEHDEDAQSILVSPDAAFLDRVAQHRAAAADHGARRIIAPRLRPGAAR
jgi:histidinol dehydrogenase